MIIINDRWRIEYIGNWTILVDNCTIEVRFSSLDEALHGEHIDVCFMVLSGKFIKQNISIHQYNTLLSSILHYSNFWSAGWLAACMNSDAIVKGFDLIQAPDFA